jgi:SNF2 family DNA or RNA helicase
MQTKLGKDFFYIKTPYKDRMFVAQALNGTWSKKEEMYRFPKNIHSMRELVKTYPELIHNSSFIQAGTRLRETQEKFLELKTKEDVQGDIRLRPYQRVDVEYLKQLPNAGIFNEPRTGKTPTSIILMKEMGFYDSLVVCPASLIWNWKKELEYWYPALKVFVVYGAPKKREKIIDEFRMHEGTKVIIYSKDTWKNEHTSWQWYTFNACFIDEAHFLRNRDTKQSKAIFDIQADHKYCLTGTPTVKHTADIWAILHFLYPEKFPSYWQFVERYFQIGDNGFGKELGEIKSGRKQELQELIGFISVQRKRNEVMNWLPEKQKITHYVQMEGKQLKIYNEMKNDMMIEAEEEEHSWDTAMVLTQLLRLRQLCLDPRLLNFKETGAKTKALLEWLDDNREPVVVMSMFTSYFDLIQSDIEKMGLKVGRIDGKMSNAEKDKTATDFQSGKVDVLLCNIISAGVGFTLDKAKVILFLDKAWNPSDNEQAEDRITPTTESKNHAHEIISFIAADSVDEYINELLEHKKSLTDVVNHGGREAIKNLLGRN